MEIRTMRIEDLSPADYNPRVDLQPGDPDYEALRRSVEEFGLVEPLVFNERTGRLVGGHQRLKVLRATGWTEVEVSVVDLDEVSEKTLNIALNKIEGDWDIEALGSLLENIAEFGEVELTGFNEIELSRFLGVSSAPKAKEVDPQKEWEAAGMPEFKQEDKTAYKSMLVHFRNEEDCQEFAKLVNQKFTEKTKYIWFPEAEIEPCFDKEYIAEDES